MGRYIETPTAKGKAKLIAEMYGGVILGQSNPSFELCPEDQALICVVDNGLFEAAGYCYDKKEFEAFLPSNSDQRPRTWLQMDKIKAEELTARG